MELYLLNMFQTVGWVARKAGVNRLNAAVMLLRMAAISTLAEKRRRTTTACISSAIPAFYLAVGAIGVPHSGQRSLLARRS